MKVISQDVSTFYFAYFVYFQFRPKLNQRGSGELGVFILSAKELNT